MLEQFLNGIVALARKSEAAVIQPIPGDPKRRLLTQGGTKEFIEVPPPGRAYKLASLPDFVEACRDTDLASDPEVFHNSDEIVVVLDRKDRREILRMPISYSQRFLAVVALGNQTVGLTAAQAIKLLRFTITGSRSEQLIPLLRKLDFKRTSTGSSNVEHGRESLGKSVEAIVQQAEQIPEQFVARVPVWNLGGLQHIEVEVTCGIYLDMEGQKIEIVPLSDEIPQAIVRAQRELHETLVIALGAETPIFQGSPLLSTPA